ncbi:hypothetical protein OB2597_02682 [Pseudooceanicola batsensis HTCC2597]|uniref:Lysozyme inhibitor LprI-like N-terminal domain-containing protein n=1 Tax=Pseudooceanicola batsensis (strain ATCC BAA-863 / DSM 15984 / KCTC 12145 / HTCC2597) TaxID=252305 RepID=A3TXD0_PSEBH|nr:lysozyme inhibitor LprI family protein [Pseudooceanicola batsensis]EAQ03490.1 hypothetical protein OB2597_02682 [Pseudooceanicola batsensis HTCC2597]
MIPNRLFALVLLFALPGAGHAQEGPAFDCAKAESSAEKLVCDDPALAALDRRLADRFAAALSVTRGLDTGAKEVEDNLRATQRGWIKGRDECWKDPDLRACVEAEYLRREAELVAEFLLEEASGVRDLVCGDAGRSLTVYEFATELPAVRVEEGDGVHVGALVSPDTPRDYYVILWGGVALGGAEPRIRDIYGETTTCRFVG